MDSILTSSDQKKKSFPRGSCLQLSVTPSEVEAPPVILRCHPRATSRKETATRNMLASGKRLAKGASRRATMCHARPCEGFPTLPLYGLFSEGTPPPRHLEKPAISCHPSWDQSPSDHGQHRTRVMPRGETPPNLCKASDRSCRELSRKKHRRLEASSHTTHSVGGSHFPRCSTSKA